MNWDRIEGQWSQVKGKAREQWGKLTDDELDVIAAAVVGGASLSGGKGTAFGAMLGALIIKLIDNGIVILGIDQNYSRIIIGVAVVLAVVLDQFNHWLAKRRLAARAGHS